ncbi:MAG: FAD binding domain-containing protein [Acidimicrobiia bacterium]|nr:FAD binding domain-containing protein [Acidimicrobiia bacterium]
MHEVQSRGTKASHHLVPATVGEAVEMLATHGSRARVIAGGTDLLLEMERRQRPGVDTLIDITAISGLAGIEVRGDRIHIGALTTHNQLVASDLAWERLTPLAQACHEVASPQLRNQATVVGNLVTASPANDTITPLRALGTTVHVESVEGARSIDLGDLYTGVRKTTLQPGELVTGVTATPLRPNQRAVYVKAGLRAAQAISVVHLTILLEFAQDVVESAKILLGSVAPTIVDSPTAERLLVGSRLDAGSIEVAAEAVVMSVEPIDDVRSTAEHRRRLLRAMTTRALTALRHGSTVAPASRVLLSPAGTVFRPGPSGDSVVETTINGTPVHAAGAVGESLLDWLRDHAGPASKGSLTGTKEGCAEGECGACTVMIDGTAVMSCLVPAVRAHGAHITTVEGLARNGSLHPVQQAFIDDAAVQCGFCIPGFLVSGAALLAERDQPTRPEILEGLSGNLCRCTGYVKIIDAIETAARS